MPLRAGLVGLLAAIALPGAGLANVPTSPHPQARPQGQAVVPSVSRLASRPEETRLALGVLAPATSRRPAVRPTQAQASRAAAPVQAVRAPSNPAFDQWRQEFRARALREGISARVFDTALAGVTPDPEILGREANQPEFNRAIWDYLDSAVSQSRIETGRRMLTEHRRLLDDIEARYGVEREVVVAVWGLESAYGTLRGRTRIIPALATLAMSSRRAEFYQEQLIGALRILQSGDVDASHMVGSWAGAMGHTQFIPTSYLAYAVDFRGDGRRDIWSDDPTDALASTAAYLARHGWQRGQPWGVEVVLPRGFNPRHAGTRRAMSDWQALGVTPQRGTSLPRQGEAELMFPAGSHGPALLVFQNFRVIKRYNNADAYAMAIGHLADRLRGAGAIGAAWPRNDRPLNRTEREELQRLLAQAGHYGGAIDGRVGSGTLEAVRNWQSQNGLPADGYVSMALLSRMRG